MPRHAVLALASEPQESILSAALSAHGIAVDNVPLGAHLQTTVMQAMRAAAEPPLLLIDVAVLAQLALHAAPFCAWHHAHCNDALLYLCCNGMYTVPPQARRWAQSLGARDLLPGWDLAHWRASLAPTLGTLLAALDVSAPDASDSATARALQALPAMLDHSTQVAQAWRQREVLDRFGTTPDALLAALLQGVTVTTRRYRMRSYDECFVGADAVDALAGVAKAVGAPHARADVLPLGQALLELGNIYHVARDQPFRDGHFFYRATAATPRLLALDLNAVIAQLHDGGVPIGDHKYHGFTYENCFVGARAVRCLRDKFDLSENEAMTLGQQLTDLFVIHHVVDQRPFRDGRFFYRFYVDET